MCDAAQEDMPLRRTVDKSKFCIKCKTQTPKVLIRHSKFCKECFIFNFTGKFRTVLSKSPALNDKTKKNAIVAISGGPSSRALLHLVKQFCLGINKATPKDSEVNVVQKDKNTKLGKVTVVHIDESAINPNHETLIAPLKEMVADYGFDFKLIPIETIMDDFIADNNGPAGDNKEKLQNLLKSTSQSTRDDLIISFKMELIKNLATITNSNLLLMGDCSTRIAIKTIGLTSEGRGFNIPFETCVENSIHEGITILRPLKDVILKEVAFYNHYLNLFVPPLFQTHATKASILKLTEHFLIGLDRSFPSTVSTVCRTASKLQPNPIYKELNGCEFCGNFIEPGVMEWRKGITVYTNTNNTDNSSVKEEDITPETEFNKNLCYGCQTNLLEIKSNPNNSKLDLLPAFITKQNTRESMKEQIKDYFL